MNDVWELADPVDAWNKRMKLSGVAFLVSRGMKVFQVAPAAYAYRSTQKSIALTEETLP